jgi:hypothetical protein
MRALYVTMRVYSFSTEIIIFLTKWPQKSADGRFTLNTFQRELLRKISVVTQSKRTRLKCETRSVLIRGIPSIFLPIFIAGLKWDPLLHPALDKKIAFALRPFIHMLLFSKLSKNYCHCEPVIDAYNFNNFLYKYACLCGFFH